MQQEIWKDIENTNGIYQVSNFGNVRSVDRYVSTGGNPFFVKGRMLKKSLTTAGYPRVQMWVNGKKYIKTIHRLVALAFIPNPENKPCINHIDGNKLNYSIDNLEWCTQRDNIIHAIRTGLNSVDNMLKAAHKNKGWEKAAESVKKKVICDDGTIYNSLKECAKAIGTSPEYLSRCINHKGGLYKGHVYRFY